MTPTFESGVYQRSFWWSRARPTVAALNRPTVVAQVNRPTPCRSHRFDSIEFERSNCLLALHYDINLNLKIPHGRLHVCDHPYPRHHGRRLVNHSCSVVVNCVTTADEYASRGRSGCPGCSSRECSRSRTEINEVDTVRAGAEVDTLRAEWGQWQRQWGTSTTSTCGRSGCAVTMWCHSVTGRDTVPSR
jgi:hypothetical protein